MGKKRAAKGTQNEVYFSSSLLAEAYRNIPNPDQSGTPIKTFYGEITSLGSKLDDQLIYSKIKNGANGKSTIIQGDIINLPDGFTNDLNFKFSRIMILSHSCNITNATSVLCCPVLLESEITDVFVDEFKGGVTKNHSIIKGNWLANHNASFVGLPAHPIDCGGLENYLAGLSYTFSLSQSLIIKSTPVIRLTYKGLSYLQQRIGLLYFRDVQDSDDCRDM
jgi:hypothetical protein